MRTPMRISFIALTALLLLACEAEEEFMACPFDDTITTTCTSDETGLKLTCVVAKHPQCPNDVCLQWKSTNNPVCSQECDPDPDAAGCPGNSKCMPFNENSEEHYCVPEEFLEPKEFLE